MVPMTGVVHYMRRDTEPLGSRISLLLWRRLGGPSKCDHQCSPPPRCSERLFLRTRELEKPSLHTNHVLEPGPSDVPQPAETWICSGSWVFLVAWDIFALLLLRTRPPISPKSKIASVRPLTLRRWCSLLAVGLIQHFWRLSRGLTPPCLTELQNISFAHVSFVKMSAIICVGGTHSIFTTMFSTKSFTTIVLNIVCRCVSGPFPTNDHRVTLQLSPRSSNQLLGSPHRIASTSNLTYNCQPTARAMAADSCAQVLPVTRWITAKLNSTKLCTADSTSIPRGVIIARTPLRLRAILHFAEAPHRDTLAENIKTDLSIITLLHSLFTSHDIICSPLPEANENWLTGNPSCASNLGLESRFYIQQKTFRGSRHIVPQKGSWLPACSHTFACLLVFSSPATFHLKPR